MTPHFFGSIRAACRLRSSIPALVTALQKQLRSAVLIAAQQVVEGRPGTAVVTAGIQDSYGERSMLQSPCTGVVDAMAMAMAMAEANIAWRKTKVLVAMA